MLLSGYSSFLLLNNTWIEPFLFLAVTFRLKI